MSQSKKAKLLNKRQQYDLDTKIELSKRRIIEWHQHWKGQTFVSFSGGKDSTVLLHLVRSLYPNIPAVFSNTGLEYPEIVAFVRTTDNVVIVKPNISFKQVLDLYGYPVASKIVAQKVRAIRHPTGDNAASIQLYLTGKTTDGRDLAHFKLSHRWRCLIDAPFEVSERCCDYIKKHPLQSYQRETGRKPYLGTMAIESSIRRIAYLRTGCNIYEGRNIKSTPLAFWLEKDIWAYIERYDLSYSSIYDKGVRSTGCIYCMFGVHLEESPNRFEILKRIHPKLWRYCMDDLGIREVLNYIGVATGDNDKEE